MIHSHVAGRVYGETQERLRARRCPSCQHEQPAPEGAPEQAAPEEEAAAGSPRCEKCGAELPPAADAAADAPVEADPNAPAE